MPFAIGIGLEKHGTRGKFGCVSGNGKGEREVEQTKNGFGQK